MAHESNLRKVSTLQERTATSDLFEQELFWTCLGWLEISLTLNLQKNIRCAGPEGAAGTGRGQGNVCPKGTPQELKSTGRRGKILSDTELTRRRRAFAGGTQFDLIYRSSIEGKRLFGRKRLQAVFQKISRGFRQISRGFRQISQDQLAMPCFTTS
jgi:hypothetical protein